MCGMDTYTTDELGRITGAQGKLRLEQEVRDDYAQRLVEKGDGRVIAYADVH